MKRRIFFGFWFVLIAAILGSNGCLSGPTAIIPTPAAVGTTRSPIQSIPTLHDSPATAIPLGPGGGGAFDVFAFSPRYVFVGTDTGGIFRSLDHGQTWQNANRGIYDYMINDIAVDPSNPSNLYVATPGGVYKSMDDGDEWQLLENGFPPKSSDQYSAEISAVAVDPSNSQTVYAGVGDLRRAELAMGNGDIYKSKDGGEQWHRLNLGDPTAASYKIVVDPLNSEIVYAATSVGFFRSMDAAETWSKIDDLQSRGLAASVDKTNAKVILYRTAWTSGVWESEDRGQTWKKLFLPACIFGCQYYRIAVDPSDAHAKTVYVGDYGNWKNDQGLFVTRDGGESWESMNHIEDAGWENTHMITRVRALGLNPYNPSELFYGQSMGLFRNDGGDSWEQLFTSPGNEGAGISPEWTGSWSSRKDINNTQANTKPMFNPMIHDEYYLGFADIYLWKTADDGISWENIYVPGDNDVRSMVADPNDKNFLTWYVGTSSQTCCKGRLYKTTDGGRKWEKAGGLPNDRIWDIAVTSGGTSFVYAATHSHGLYWSKNGGSSFNPRNGVGGHTLPLGPVYDLALSRNDPNLIYAALNTKEGGIYKSIDAGENWQEVGPFNGCYAVVLSPIHSNEIYAGCALQLYKSTDGGTTWDTLFEGREHPLHGGVIWKGAYIRDIALHPVDPDTLCFVIKDDPYHDQASGGGLYCTKDGGKTWHEIAAKLGLILRGVSVAFHPLPDRQTGGYDLFYMTGGNGAYKIPSDLLTRLLSETGTQ